jgi:hypothetical protein
MSRALRVEFSGALYRALAQEALEVDPDRRLSAKSIGGSIYAWLHEESFFGST